MAIYAISDLHLSYQADKPMKVFGWDNYEEKIKEDWLAKVKEEDTVLLPGDFSWSTYLEDMYLDFSYLAALPGKKLLLKGNHDYWWTTITSMRRYLKEKQMDNIDFIYNNSYEQEGYLIAGTRGWIIGEQESDNAKIYRREVERLKLSLQDAVKKGGTEKPIIVCMHYPPIKGTEKSDFVKVMQQYNVKKCIYGHLHGPSQQEIEEGLIDGIEFRMVSCDYTEFKLIKIVD